MKKKALRKEFFIEIKKSFSRFISIFFIVALGVAFFAGIRSAKPDMRLSADQFYDDSNLMDIRVVSTLGLTEDDVAALKKVDGVKQVQAAHSVDVLCTAEEKELVVKMLSVPDSINQVKIEAGRLPQNDTECIVDAAFLQNTKYKIGDTVSLQSGTEDPLSDTLSRDSFTIVGSCITSYYLSINKGSSAIGGGDVDSFIMIPDFVFASDVYTEIYLTLDNVASLVSYSDKYNDAVTLVEDRIEDTVSEKREKARYNEIIVEAQSKIDDATAELADAKVEADEKLADGKQKLDDAAQKISDGKQKIADNEKKLADGKNELKGGKEKIADAWDTIAAKEAQIAKAEVKIKAGKADLLDGQTEYNKNKKVYEDGIAQIQSAEAQLAAQEQTLTSGEQELAKAKQTLAEQEANPTLPTETIEQMKASIAQTEAELVAGRAQLKKAKEEVATKRTELENGKVALDTAKMQLTAAQKQLKSSEATLTSGKQQLAAGKQELLDKEADMKKAEQDITDGEKKLEKAKKKIADGEVKLADANKEYEDGTTEAQKKISDAQKKIAEAQEDVSSIKMAKWYVLDRNSLQTYVEFGMDSDRIGAIGEVFPIIFFLVAALVSLTTMTRMVEEQRTQIGTLKALGYNKISIAGKYLGYAFLATLSGSLFGGVIGCLILPKVIIGAYQIMYRNLPVVVTPLNQYYITMAAGIAITCVITATTIACYAELATSPAQLMRPAAPKQGKRVLLERIPFIWNRMNFTMKSAVRNLFRYKKRFFMTIFGIGGCMALMLVGFGLKDSIFSITALQYNNIHVFDGVIQLNEDASAKDKAVFQETISQDKRILLEKYQYQSSVDVVSGKIEKTAYLTALEDTKDLEDFIHFQSRTKAEKYTLTDDGVIITEKLAKLLKVSTGDTIYLKNGDTDRIKVTISAVTENYVQHYIYMTQTLYKDLYGRAPEYNQILFTDNNLTTKEEDQLEKDLLKLDRVSSISMTTSVESKFGDMLGSLDVVILVLIISAGGLAFVVLYNLNNISINERKRELATIKVLGFYDLELSEYVYRENVVLTIFGIGVGIVLGLFLHHYIIITSEVDMIMFGRMIKWKSYLYSALLTMLFAFLINLSMHFKLKKVDMAASLKSIE